MGGHDSYRDTFTSWAVTTRETKGEGSDLAMAKARFISITLWGEVDMSARTQDN